jgi:hypothetical protein
MPAHSLRILAAAAAVLLLAACGTGSADQGASSTDNGAAQEQAPAPALHATHGTPPPPGPLRAGERFVALTMPRPYRPEPPPRSTDEYRCFLIDPQLTAPAFITGSQFLPQNAEIVHHAILFRVAPGDVAQARTLDADAPGDGWTCFGGTGIATGGGRLSRLDEGAAWIAAWAPGGGEAVLRKGTGYRMEPGSQIVMQVHYSLLALDGRPPGADRSGVRLRMTGDVPGTRELQAKLLVAPVELPCAPGEKGQLCDRDWAVLDVWSRFGEHAGGTVAGLNLLCNEGGAPRAGPTQSCDSTVRQAGTVYAVAGHMHLLGRSIKVELNPGTAKARTLLDVPVYDFDDQGARPLATPLRIKRGDVLRVTCTHDATLRAKLPALRDLPPRYVVWGEGTSDEMCLGVVTWSPDKA